MFAIWSHCLPHFFSSSSWCIWGLQRSKPVLSIEQLVPSLCLLCRLVSIILIVSLQPDSNFLLSFSFYFLLPLQRSIFSFKRPSLCLFSLSLSLNSFLLTLEPSLSSSYHRNISFQNTWKLLSLSPPLSLSWCFLSTLIQYLTLSLTLTLTYISRPIPPSPVWPDWAIYWTLGNFLKPLATIIFF